MTAAKMPAAASSNYQKHTNPSRPHQWLLRRFHRRVAAHVAAAISQHQPGTRPVVLDAGCGEGFVAAYLAAQWPDLPIIGVESRLAPLGMARRLVAARGWLQGDVGALPFRDHSIPLVLCLEVLEHLNDPWAAVAELQRVSSGHIIVSVPNQPFFALGNLLRGKNFATLGDDPDHRSHWSGATFLRELRRHLHVTHFDYVFPWVIAVAVAGDRPGA